MLLLLNEVKISVTQPLHGVTDIPYNYIITQNHTR
jgi:hypothetical protein